MTAAPSPTHLTDPSHPEKWSISTSLAWLVAACILPGALLSAYFIVTDYQQQKTRAIRDVIATARAAAATLDRDLASIESGLRVLATAPSLATDDLANFYQRAKAALPYQNINNYVLLDAHGRQQLNTLVPWGSPLPQVGGPQQLQRIFQTDTPVLSDIFIGPVTGQPILAMSVPVKRDGATIYSLGAGIFPERMSGVLKAQHFPADWISVIIDSQGKVVVRSHDMARYLGKPAAPALVRAASESREGVLETVTLEGVPVITAFSRSKLSGWSVAVGIPKAELTANLKPDMALLIITNTLVFAAALAIAWRLAMSRMIMPTDRLLKHMERIARGEDPGSAINHQSSQEFAALEQGFADMSARLREREQERETLLGRLVNTLESISDGFYLLDDQWRFAYVNHRAETLLKRGRKTLIGQDHWTVLAKEDAALLRSAFERAVVLHQSANFEAQLPSLGLWLDIHAYPTEQGLAVYFQDVSELRSAQQANEAQRIAEAANKAKTEFLSRMSHELRTPLNAVLGFSQVLKMDPTEPLSPHHRRMVDQIESSGLHLLNMISDVLDVSRIEAGGMQITITDVEIHPLINDCQKMIVADANAAGLSLQAEAPNHGIAVRADKTRLKQVLLNLLSNAVKYNQPGGRVSLLAQRHDKLVRFSIEDTGIGMTPAQVQHLFEPFNRLGRESSQTAGSGIGLVITKRLLELMGSELKLTTTEQQGSTFYFDLPLSTANVEAHDEPMPPVPQSDLHETRKVLYVEDNAANGEIMAAILNLRPCIDLTLETTVRSALARLEAESFDLVLLDMHLPDGTGLDILAWLSQHERLRDTAVVIVSADITPATIALAAQAGAHTYLNKPLDLKHTLSVVDSLLHIS